MRNKDMSFCQNGPLTDRKAVRAARKEFGRGSLELKQQRKIEKTKRKKRKKLKKETKELKITRLRKKM